MRAVHICLPGNVRIVGVDRSAFGIVHRVGDRAVGVRRLTLLPCGSGVAGPEGRHLSHRVQLRDQRGQLLTSYPFLTHILQPPLFHIDLSSSVRRTAYQAWQIRYSPNAYIEPAH